VKYVLLIVALIFSAIFLFSAKMVYVLPITTPPSSGCGMPGLVGMIFLWICIIISVLSIWLWWVTIARFRRKKWGHTVNDSIVIQDQ